LTDHPRQNDAIYKPAEEVAHAVTHGLGCVLAVVGLVVLTVQTAARGQAWELGGALVFGVSMVVLYLASTLYHAVTEPRAKSVLARIDHAAIYLLIAGTYTPLCLGPLRGPWGWSLLGAVWALGIVGAVQDVLAVRRRRWLSVSIYLAMGWLVIVAVGPLVDSVDRITLAWILAGGVFYTGGVAFYLWRRLRWHHAIWHVWVVCGSISHWFAVQRALAL
jgi:hemolysin III